MTGLVVAERAQLRHASCGYELRRASRASLPVARAFCGAHIVVPPEPSTAPHCPECLAAARRHGQECECWKLWTQKGARVP